MATYLILGLAVTLSIVPVLIKFRRFITVRQIRQYIVVVSALFVMTAIFDNLIVGLGIVGYDRSKILGLYIGYAPVEDFFYPLVAAYLLPILWWKK